jgi:hypothetical protein
MMSLGISSDKRKDNNMLTEQEVKQTIERHIAERDKQIIELLQRTDMPFELKSNGIALIEAEMKALFHLQHDLKLCDCPQEV